MSTGTPDLILYGGRIATLDPQSRVVTALAAHASRIVALGDDEEIRALAGDATRTIDLQGRTAIPGIVDSHTHPDMHAARLSSWENVNPERIPTRDALLECISNAAGTRGADDWIACYRFDDVKSGGYPTLDELDRAADGRPLFIQRTDGHLGLANRRAFDDVGLGPDPDDPPFGSFDRHPETGALTGLMREAAIQFFLSHIHRNDTPQLIADGLEKVFDDWASYGITSVYNSLCGRKSIEAYQLMREQGRLRMRTGIIVSGREDDLVDTYIRAGIRSGFGDDWIRVIGVEWCPDCSTSGRTAAYYEPYVGTPIEGEPVPNTGMLLYEADDLNARAIDAHKAGLLVMIEGVGDRGIDFALDAIEACLEAHPVEDHRMRVEHCCCVTPRILTRLKNLGAVDSSATGFMYDLGGRLPRQPGPGRHEMDVAAPQPDRHGHSGARSFRRHDLPGQSVSRHVVDGDQAVGFWRRPRALGGCQP